MVYFQNVFFDSYYFLACYAFGSCFSRDRYDHMTHLYFATHRCATLQCDVKDEHICLNACGKVMDLRRGWVKEKLCSDISLLFSKSTKGFVKFNFPI